MLIIFTRNTTTKLILLSRPWLINPLKFMPFFHLSSSIHISIYYQLVISNQQMLISVTGSLETFRRVIHAVWSLPVFWSFMVFPYGAWTKFINRPGLSKTINVANKAYQVDTHPQYYFVSNLCYVKEQKRISSKLQAIISASF